MASVSIDGRFSILTKDKNLGSGGVQLSVPSGGQIAVVRIDPQNFAAFCSIRGIEVSEKFSAEVGVFPAPMYKKLSPEVQAEVTDLRMRMSEALRTCLSYAKYHLSLYFVGEGLFSVVHENVQFDDQPHKHSFPSDIIITGSVTSFTPISPDVQGLLQASIDMQSRPFSAMRHLHKAKQEVSAPRTPSCRNFPI